MDLGGLWVCTYEGMLVRADQIVKITVVDGNGRTRKFRPRDQVSICADLPGGTEGDSQTSHALAKCPAAQAEQLTASLLRLIHGSQAGAGPGPAYIYREKPEDGPWVTGPELPDGRILEKDTPEWRRPP